MAYLEYQISNGDLDQASPLVDELKAASSRPKALRMLAVAHAKSGNKAAADHLFQLAFSAATSLSDEFVRVPGVSALSDEYDRAIAIWEVAQAQSDVGECEEISSTIQKLVQHAESSKSGLSISRRIFLCSESMEGPLDPTIILMMFRGRKRFCWSSLIARMRSM